MQRYRVACRGQKDYLDAESPDLAARYYAQRHALVGQRVEVIDVRDGSREEYYT